MDEPNDITIHDRRHVPLSESERLPNDSIKLNATFWACVFVVKTYDQQRFTAHNCRNRLQQRMDDCRKAPSLVTNKPLWDHNQYLYSAMMYREAIWYVYGERLTFDGLP